MRGSSFARLAGTLLVLYLLCGAMARSELGAAERALFIAVDDTQSMRETYGRDNLNFKPADEEKRRIDIAALLLALSVESEMPVWVFPYQEKVITDGEKCFGVSAGA